MLFILITLGCLVGSAIFSGFENGILAVRRARLDHAIEQGSWTARIVDNFLRHPATLLGTILLGNNLCNVFAAVYFESWLKLAFADAMASSTRANVTIFIAGSAVLTLVLLVCSEITPKVWYRQRPLNRTRYLVPVIYGFYLISYPFVKILTLISNLLNRLITRGSNRAGTDIALMRDDFRMMLLESQEANVLDAEAARLLDNSLDYHRHFVRSVMTPAADVQTLPADFTLQQALDRARDTGTSRFPVASPNDPERWIGIFAVYDAIYTVPRDHWPAEKVLDYLRPIVAIREDAGISQVLTRSRTHHTPLLVVTDNTGTHTGIVAANDVVFPLFGDLNA